jgi:hypothetical protein
MIVKALEQTFIIKASKDDNGEPITLEIPGKYVVKRVEIQEVLEFCEIINEKTKKPYKTRCLLRTIDGWLPVKHTFEQLMEMKNTPQRVIIKGLYAAARSSKGFNRNK